MRHKSLGKCEQGSLALEAVPWCSTGKYVTPLNMRASKRGGQSRLWTTLVPWCALT